MLPSMQLLICFDNLVQNISKILRKILPYLCWLTWKSRQKYSQLVFWSNVKSSTQMLTGFFQKGANIKYRCDLNDHDKNYRCHTLCFTQSLQFGNNFWVFGKTSIGNMNGIKVDKLCKLKNWIIIYMLPCIKFRI